MTILDLLEGQIILATIPWHKIHTSFYYDLTTFLLEKIKTFEHTNLILATLPYRYDLSESHKVNEIIREANFILRKIAYNSSHVHLLDLHLLQRWQHTKHGMHINKRGKKSVAKD